MLRDLHHTDGWMMGWPIVAANASRLLVGVLTGLFCQALSLHYVDYSGGRGGPIPSYRNAVVK